MKDNYTADEVLALLGSAFEEAEQEIFRGLYGADNKQRLESLDTLDALQLAHKHVRVLINDGDNHE